jgi:RimJ/RimL family protein N-acetyltransferase
MILIPTTDKELIKSIITEPTLWKLEYGQGMNIEDFEVDESFTYLVIRENDDILGIFQTREITRILVEAHIYLLPKYWGKDYSSRALNALFRYYEHSNYHKVITDVPQCCSHVIRLLKKTGCKQCGYIDKGVIYNNKLMGLLLFSYDLKRPLNEYV